MKSQAADYRALPRAAGLSRSVQPLAMLGVACHLMRSTDNTARLWKVPQPMRGDPERIMLWTQVITGLEVDDLTAVRVLDAAALQQRRDRLQKLGARPSNNEDADPEAQRA